ncbi:MAG: hypothetical protein L6367_13710 [Cellulomonas sp.]|nr:hypothetical protein [Cellulomonas sp.]
MSKLTDEQALARLEEIDPATARMHDRRDVTAIAEAVAVRDHADDELLAAVREARGRGVPWVLIASALGVSHQGARKRYKPLVEPDQVARAS